jgi:hypothetical protein
MSQFSVLHAGRLTAMIGDGRMSGPSHNRCDNPPQAELDHYLGGKDNF